jgi:hypothetical protein
MTYGFYPHGGPNLYKLSYVFHCSLRPWALLLLNLVINYDRTSKHGATNVTAFELVYGHEVILPVEINLQTCRIAKQDALSAKDYIGSMMDRIDELPEGWFRALKKIEKDKLRVAKAYE